MIPIIKKELKSYFLSPIGYIFMGFFLLISGFFFVGINLVSGSSNYNIMLDNISFLFMILVPILTMRIFAEEFRQKTDQLLLTSPLSTTNIIVGKYLAAVVVFLLTLLITCCYPIIMSFGGLIPIPLIVGGYIGFLLLGSCFIAVGLFVSSLTENQVVSAVISFVILLFIQLLEPFKQIIPNDTIAGLIFIGLIIVGASFLVYKSIKNIFLTVVVAILGVTGAAAVYFTAITSYNGIIIKVVDWFSLLKRYEGFSKGNINFGSLVYFISFATAFVFLTVQKIQRRYWK
jgi:ABC-2 type transport system permease protein